MAVGDEREREREPLDPLSYPDRESTDEMWDKDAREVGGCFAGYGLLSDKMRWIYESRKWAQTVLNARFDGWMEARYSYQRR